MISEPVIVTCNGVSLWFLLYFIWKWIGGAFYEGTSTVDIYSGQYIASNFGVVVVTGDYRLGVLGFLMTDTLTGNVSFHFTSKWKETMVFKIKERF